MKTTVSGGALAVATGEVFGIVHDDYGTSGYRTSFKVPTGVTHLGADRQAAEGFGGAPRVVERFRCLRRGSYRLVMTEARAWESNPLQQITVIDCG